MNHWKNTLTSLFKNKHSLLRLVQILSLILVLLVGVCVFLHNKEAAAQPGGTMPATDAEAHAGSVNQTEPVQTPPVTLPGSSDTQAEATQPSQQETTGATQPQATSAPEQETAGTTQPQTTPATQSTTEPTAAPSTPSTAPTDTAPTQAPTDPPAPPASTAAPETSLTFPLELEHGLRIDTVGSYTGMYMEDGSDEILSGILMLVVTNTSETDIQYAQLHLSDGNATADFSLSTLPAGATVVVLEENRMAYSASKQFISAAAEKVVLFSEPLTLMEDQLEIQVLEGCVNVTNISGQDLEGDIVIYYKNSVNGMYYGGITYRIRIEGGLKAGELKQALAGHIYLSGSTILLVTCG